ncbi:replication initiation protein [Fusobacterium polymorphum]|uniref:replication initiation protein n=3 Tax=Fusobacterium nucleatum subsp. polymorphum TaxID=76857 RepID=UPI00300839C2
MNELKVVENKEEIVIYNNDLNTKVYLKKFNNFNWDIFMIVVSALAFTKNGVAEISLVEIKKKTNYTSQNNENFKNKLKETNRKILQSVCEIETGEDTEQFPLFKKFKIIGKKALRVEVGEDYMSFFTDYSEYTSFGLKTFLELKNKYTKPLFKQLMQFKATGKAFFKMEDFRNRLDIPKSLSFSKIRDRILIPSIKDFSILFKNYKIIAKVLDGEEIEIVENMSPEAKKDRRQVTNINFFFTLTKKKDIITETEVVRNQVNKEELTEEEFYNLEPPIPSEEEIEEYNAMQEEVKLSIEIDWLKEDMKRAKERLNTILESRKIGENRDSAGYSIDSDIINKLKMDIEDYYNQIKEKENKIEKLVPLLERAKERENVIKQSERLQTTDKNDVENKEENKIDYDVLIKNFLAGQGIDYRYVETNINFLKEKYTDEIIYKEIVRINGIKDVRANIDPKKYLIASINNLDEIKEEKKVDRKQSGRLQTINENNVENKEEIINSLFNFADEEE